MKKLLSVTLALMMLIGIMGSVPASAASSDAYANLPYYFVDFEDGYNFTNVGVSSIVDGGAGGSGKCLKIEEADTVPFNDYLVVKPGPAVLSGTVPAGGALKISFWLKLGQEMKENRAYFTFIIGKVGGGYVLDSTGNHPMVLADVTSTDWQKITCEIPVTEQADISTIFIRTALGGGIANQLPGGSDPSTPGGARAYYFDDMEIAVYHAGVVMTDNVSTDATDYRMTFENGSSIKMHVAGVGFNVPGYNAPISSANGLQTIEIVDNPKGSGKVLKWTEKSTNLFNDSNVWVGADTVAGYNFLAPVVPAGSTLTYKFKYYFTQQMKDNDAGFGIANQNGYDCYTGNIDKTPGVWHEAEMSYTNTTGAEVTLSIPMLRVHNVLGAAGTLTLEGYKGGGTEEDLLEGYGDREIYIDDFCSYITAAGETKAEIAVPTSSALKGTGVVAAGQQIKFINTFVPATGSTATDTSFIRFVNTDANGNTASLGTYKITDTITVPALPADGTVSIEVIPVDSNGLVGEVVSYPISVVEAPVPTLPYYFVDFEDDNNFTNVGVTSIIDGGAAGSGKCLKIEEADSANLNDYLIVKPGPAILSGAISAGGTLRVSFLVKLGQVMTQDLAAFTLIGGLTDGTTSYIFDSTGTHPVVTADHTSTDWQRVTFEWTAPKDCIIKTLFIRTANNGITNRVSGGTAENPGAKVYYIDDVEAVVYPEGVVMTDNVTADATDYRMTFENGSSIRMHVAGVGYKAPSYNSPISSANGLQTIEVVDNPAGDGKVLKLTEKSASQFDDSNVWISASTTTASNGTWLAPVVPAGGTLTYKFKYYFTQQMKDNNSGFGIANANGYDAYSGNVDKTPGVWHEAEMSYTNNTEASVSITRPMLRVHNVYGSAGTLTLEGYKGGGTEEELLEGYGDREIYIDDFCSYITAAGETKAEIAVPTSSALTVEGVFAEGQQITLSHQFTSCNSVAIDASIVRLVNTDANGIKASLGTYGIDDTITVPALPAGGTVSIEVIPVDSNGLVGETVSYPVSVVIAPEAPVTLTLTDADNTASANISFGDTYAGATNVSLYIAFYDENYKMINRAIFNGTSAAEIPGTLTYTSDDDVKYIKAFAWSYDGSYIPLVESELIEK